MGLVSNKAFNGDIKSNPYNFQHFHLNYICILKDKQMVPTKPYTPNYEKYAYARNFNSIFEDGGNLMWGKFPNITYNDYSGGYALYCFDLTPDRAATESHISPISQGNLSIDLRFSRPLTDIINVICYLEYENELDISSERVVNTDY